MDQEFKSLDARAKRQVLDRERRIMDVFQQIIETGVKQRGFRPEPLSVTVNPIMVLGYLWALRRWALKGTVTLEEFKDAQIQMILAGLRDGGKPHEERTP